MSRSPCPFQHDDKQTITSGHETSRHDEKQHEDQETLTSGLGIDVLHDASKEGVDRRVQQLEEVVVEGVVVLLQEALDVVHHLQGEGRIVLFSIHERRAKTRYDKGREEV